MVKLGPREYEVADKLALDFQLPDADTATRVCVTVVTALNNAVKLGLSIQLIGPNGRRYAYSLQQPKVAHELNPSGNTVGKKLDLIAGFKSGKAKTHLKPIDGGKK